VILKFDLDVLQTRGWFVECLSQTLGAQQSVTKFIAMTVKNLVSPKAAAKHDFLFNKPTSEAVLLNKSSRLAAALGVTIIAMYLVTLCCAT
jgi:hypothetical protein